MLYNGDTVNVGCGIVLSRPSTLSSSLEIPFRHDTSLHFRFHLSTLFRIYIPFNDLAFLHACLFVPSLYFQNSVLELHAIDSRHPLMTFLDPPGNLLISSFLEYRRGLYTKHLFNIRRVIAMPMKSILPCRRCLASPAAWYVAIIPLL